MNCRACSTNFTNLKDLTRHAIGEKLKCQPVYFTCIPCWMPLQTIPDVVQHIESEEHTILALATGIRFYKQTNNSSEGTKESFPPHNCCLLCSARDLSPNNGHLRSPQHKYFVSLMKNIFKNKQIQCSEMPISFVSKLIDVKQEEFSVNAQARKVLGDSSQVFCELCNIYFSKLAHYMQHLEDESHRRMEQFIIMLSRAMKGMKIVGSESHIRVTKTFSNSLIPLFHCELCSIWVDSTVNYSQHTRSANHRRIKELFSKLSNKKSGDAVTLRDVVSETVSHYSYLQPYCKLCAIQFSDHMTYRLHLEASCHRRIEQFVNNLPGKSDKKFIHVYIDAQAHMKFNETPPPNYCDVCDILHLKSETYMQHLNDEEHKQSEKYCLKVKRANKDCFGRKCSKTIKASPGTSHQHSLDKKHKTSDHVVSQIMLCRKKRYACREKKAANTNTFSRPGFDAGETNSGLSPRPVYETDDTDSDSDFLPGFGACETKRFGRQRRGSGDREFLSRQRVGASGTERRRPHPGFGYREMYNNSRPHRFDSEDSEVNDNFPPPNFEGNQGAGNFFPGFEEGENIGELPPHGFEDSGADDDFDPQEHYCELCDFRSCNPLQYDKHLTGDEHKKMRRSMLNKKGKEMSFDAQELEAFGDSHPMQYNCELCDVFNRNYQEYEFHLNNPKHKKNQWLLYVFKQKCL